MPTLDDFHRVPDGYHLSDPRRAKAAADHAAELQAAADRARKAEREIEHPAIADAAAPPHQTVLPPNELQNGSS